MVEQPELPQAGPEGLPEVIWRTKLSPSMDRAEQLRRYAQATSPDTAQRQVRLHREEQARLRKRQKR